jgi:hypothetical protein
MTQVKKSIKKNIVWSSGDDLIFFWTLDLYIHNFNDKIIPFRNKKPNEKTMFSSKVTIVFQKSDINADMTIFPPFWTIFFWVYILNDLYRGKEDLYQVSCF